MKLLKSLLAFLVCQQTISAEVAADASDIRELQNLQLPSQCNSLNNREEIKLCADAVGDLLLALVPTRCRQIDDVDKFEACIQTFVPAFSFDLIIQQVPDECKELTTLTDIKHCFAVVGSRISETVDALPSCLEESTRALATCGQENAAACKDACAAAAASFAPLQPTLVLPTCGSLQNEIITPLCANAVSCCPPCMDEFTVFASCIANDILDISAQDCSFECPLSARALIAMDDAPRVLEDGTASFPETCAVNNLAGQTRSVNTFDNFVQCSITQYFTEIEQAAVILEADNVGNDDKAGVAGMEDRSTAATFLSPVKSPFLSVMLLLSVIWMQR